MKKVLLLLLLLIILPYFSFSQEKTLVNQKLSNRNIDSLIVYNGGNTYLMQTNIVEKQKAYLKSIKNKLNKELKNFKLVNSAVYMIDNSNGTATVTVVHAYGKGLYGLKSFTEQHIFYNVPKK